MAGRFTWLDRKEGESVRAYDNRINELAAFHSGYAFLSYENYCPEFYAFAVFTVWNDEFNKKLVNPLPEGGFMMHCDAKKAEELCALGHGYPIFVKLVSRLGRLYVESFALADKDVVYDLYFNGCDVKKPEGHVFYVNEKPELLPVIKPVEQNVEAGTVSVSHGSGIFRRSSYIHGSYFRGSYQKGSYRSLMFVKGSYIGGSFVSGAIGISSYLRGSYIRGSFSHGSYINISGSYNGKLSGSYLSWFFGGGSYLKLLFGAGSYRSVFFGGSSYAGGLSGSFKGFSFGQGSYSKSSYIGGSYTGGHAAGSYINGSYTGRYFMTGSFYNGSYHRGSFIYGGFADVPVSFRIPGNENKNDEHRHEEFVIRRLIEELGYGLDLI